MTFTTFICTEKIAWFTKQFWEESITSKIFFSNKPKYCTQAKDDNSTLLLPCTSADCRKGKGKGHRTTWYESTTQYEYSSTLSLTPALDVGGWSMPRPGSFTSWKQTSYPLYRRLCGPQGRDEPMMIISPPQGFDPQTVQLVASRYTDWAIPVSITQLSNTHTQWLPIFRI